MAEIAPAKKRIEWIDCVKGIAIILVIAGHTVTPGIGKQGLFRGLVFSFHMPLFFIVSGITTKTSTGPEQFFERTEKSFKRLIVPVLLMYPLICIVNLCKYGLNTGLREYLATIINTIVYASGADISSLNIPALGALWFLVVLFFGRTIYAYLSLKMRKKEIGIVCISMAFFGILFGKIQWLPLSFDIVLTIMPFIFVGQLVGERLMQTNRNEPKNGGVANQIAKLLICTAGWLALFYIIIKSTGQYFELATRRYPCAILSYLCALFGSAAACIASQLIIRAKSLSKGLLIVGKHSMLIYLIHVADVWWAFLWGRSPSAAIQIIVRTVIDILIALFIISILKIRKRVDRTPYIALG